MYIELVFVESSVISCLYLPPCGLSNPLWNFKVPSLGWNSPLVEDLCICRRLRLRAYGMRKKVTSTGIKLESENEKGEEESAADEEPNKFYTFESQTTYIAVWLSRMLRVCMYRMYFHYII